MPNWNTRPQARSQVSHPQATPVQKRTRKTLKRRLPQPPKARPTAPVVRAIPAGYEDDSRAIQDLIAGGLPVTPEYIQLYKKLEEDMQEAELLSAAFGRLHVPITDVPVPSPRGDEPTP